MGNELAMQLCKCTCQNTHREHAREVRLLIKVENADVPSGGVSRRV